MFIVYENDGKTIKCSHKDKNILLKLGYKSELIKEVDKDPFEINIERTYIDDRIENYPSFGDFADALMKEMNYRRMQGENLTQDMDDWVNACLKVKKDFPKPEEMEVN